jgi:hypothetical protein
LYVSQTEAETRKNKIRSKHNRSTEAIVVESNLGDFIHTISVNNCTLLHIQINNFSFITFFAQKHSPFFRDILVEEGDNSFSYLN